MAKQKDSPAALPPASSGYTVLARRYRPQQLSDLAGQEAVAQALTNAIQSGRVAHAYLFTGPRGVGKTSTARILAKCLNCVKGPTATPCDKCEICKGIISGDDVDVLEIDGASNNKVDEVRDLRSNVQYAPARARFKIYIIDEVHMLTTAAFNALLKTLEEPPPHVKFIFATTEVQKVPLTILSRCQRFDFAGIGPERIVERLRAIVEEEGLKADDEALGLVARRAGGSMRDAQSLLDQLLAFGGEKLTADQVHQLLGTAQDERVLELAKAVLDHDSAKVLELVGNAADAGLQLGELVDQVTAYWRDLMILSATGGAADDISLAPRHKPTLAAQAKAMSLDTILAGLDVLSTTRLRMPKSNHPRVLVEMAMVRLSRLEDLVSITQLAKWAAQGSAPAGAPKPTRPVNAVQPPEAVKKKPPVGAETAFPNGGPIKLTAENIEDFWAYFLDQLPPMIRGQLQNALTPAISGPNTLVIKFPPGYNHAREYCQEPDQLARIESAIRQITGQPYQVRVEAGRADVAGPTAATETAPQPSRQRSRRAEVMQEPLLKRAEERLGAQIVRMDDDFGLAPTRPPAPDESEER